MYLEFLYFIPVEKSLDIAFLELVELRWQWFCDSGICQQLFAAWGEVVYLSYSFFDEFAEIGCFGGIDNSMVKAVVFLAMYETADFGYAVLEQLEFLGILHASETYTT